MMTWLGLGGEIVDFLGTAGVPFTGTLLGSWMLLQGTVLVLGALALYALIEILIVVIRVSRGETLFSALLRWGQNRTYRAAVADVVALRDKEPILSTVVHRVDVDGVDIVADMYAAKIGMLKIVAERKDAEKISGNLRGMMALDLLWADLSNMAPERVWSLGADAAKTIAANDILHRDVLKLGLLNVVASHMAAALRTGGREAALAHTHLTSIIENSSADEICQLGR